MVVKINDQFTSDEKQRIIELYESGKTQKEIGNIFGLPRRTIGKLLICLGLHKDHAESQKSRFDPEFILAVQKLRSEGKTYEQIATITGHSTSAISRATQKHGDNKLIVRPDIDVKQLCLDYQNGDNMHILANKYDITTYLVKQYLVNNDIHLRKPRVDGGGRRPTDNISLPEFVDSKEWFDIAYLKYGVPSIASFINKLNYFVRQRLKEHNIRIINLSDRLTTLDYPAVVASYKEFGSMSKVAERFQCTVQAVKNILIANGITPTSTSEMFTGEGNPFSGKQHDAETRELCANIGSFYGKKFWADHPEYIEVVREKQKLLWADLAKRADDSKHIATLRKEGKCNSHRGTMQTRFGKLDFDSSYEAKFIEFCENDSRIINVERDFDLIEYEYDGVRHFVPDFRIWLANGEFLVIEIKADWYAKQPKEQAKIIAGFGALADKFMVVGDNTDLVGERIRLALTPCDFNFDDVELREVIAEQYLSFYGAFHYLGKTGRRGYTLGAFLAGKLIAVATIGSITRNETALRHRLEPGQVRELVRFCIHPDFHKPNFASWFLSRVVKRYSDEYCDVQLLVSFADSSHNHVGTIYKAANWISDGETNTSYHYVGDNDMIIHKKTVYDQAVRAGLQERVYAQLNNLRRSFEFPKYRFYLRLRQY